MARYKIYDNSSDVITPVGEVLTAEQWLDRYPWGRFAKMIVGGGVINGSVALIFDEAVERCRRAGCDFSGCTTDEDYLAAMEAFEDAPPADTGRLRPDPHCGRAGRHGGPEPAGCRIRKETRI